VRQGDADDPAIWVHPTDSAQSLVIGALKEGGLDVYDLEGQRVQAIQPAGVRYNNVDVDYNFNLEGNLVDLAVTTDRYGDKLVFFTIDPQTRQLKDVTDPANPLLFTPPGEGSNKATTAYGLALYHSPTTGDRYAFATRREELEIAQLEFIDNSNGMIKVRAVRTITLPAPVDDREPQAEGMVVDQQFGFLYIAQEKVGIWKVAAEPDGDPNPVLIHAAAPEGDTLVADVEGLTIYYAAAGAGYLIASSQSANNFSVYTRGEENQYLGRFQVGTDIGVGIDGSQGCDGAGVISTPLGTRFAQGLLVVHDGTNGVPVQLTSNPNANTNFKFVPWEVVANAFDPPLIIDTTYDPRQP
jgi:myo-inositol-hexaphosphate 3-phosphohydrolase